MSPKYRSKKGGGIEGWLDDEASGGRRGGPNRKITSKHANLLDPSEGNATVIEVLPASCMVRLDGGNAEVLCNYRRAGVFKKNEDGPRERTPVAIGDRVKVSVLGSRDGVVEGVCTRINKLIRPAPGREGDLIHVIAANVDLMTIVVSIREPDFSAGLLDRFLVAAGVGRIQPVICVNKMDLMDSNNQPWKMYQDLGIECFLVSAKQHQGVDALAQRLMGKKVVFCGHSGVGKTSLLRELLGQEVGKVEMISNATKKGRHTTTSAVLMNGPEGSGWIDTPGVRAFGLTGVEPETLAEYFPEFRDLECSTFGCLHYDEEECRARDLFRYSSYRRIFESLGTMENDNS